MFYGYRKQLNLPFNEALKKVKSAIVTGGFGIMFEHDIQNNFESKLKIKFDNYVIFGACRPPLAQKVLNIDKELGLLLPCNVIVYEENNQVFCSVILPSKVMAPIQNPQLTETIAEAEKLLIAVVDSL